MRAFLVAALLPVAVAVVLAVDVPVARAEGGPFGLGIILGSPTGLSAKLYLNRNHAVDAAIGGALLNESGLHAHADYLWHPFKLTEEEAFVLPFYFGVGGRALLRGDNDQSHFHLGVRVPVGILFDFKTVPLDVFLEIAGIIDIIEDEPNGRKVFDINASVGVRYYF
jgi:hypothetical protein